MSALANRLLAAKGLVYYGPDSIAPMIDWAFDRGRLLATAALTGQRHCRVCGCTDTATCRGEDPCHWVVAGLCSACAPFVEGGA